MVSHKENSCDIFVDYGRPTENSSWYDLKRNTGILIFLHTGRISRIVFIFRYVTPTDYGDRN